MSAFRPALLASALVAVGSLAGCSFAPNYTRPAVAVPDQFREVSTSPHATVGGVTWTPAQPGDDRPRGAWWESYEDPQLNSLEGQVQISNQSIQAAEASFRQARAAAAVARSALFPVISVDPAFGRSRASRTLASAAGNLPAAGGPTIVEQYSLPFDASYEVDLWGRLRNNAAASAATAQASAADVATALLSTQAELAQDYFQLRATDTERQIIADTVASFRQSLNETRSLFRAGIDSEEDVARAETQLNTAVAQETDFGVARSAYEHAIAVLIGKPPSAFSLAAAPLPAATRPPQIPAALPSDLLQRRPDIAAAERRAAAANAGIGVATAAWFPRFTLSASGGWEATALGQLLDWPSRFWTIGPQLAETLLDGGARRAQTEQARAAFDQASANYRQTVLTAYQAVEDNLAAVRILEQEAGEQHVAVVSSQHLLDLANTRFKLGIDSYLNVITAQTALLSNREAEAQIQLRQIIASLSLVKAIGGGWDVTRLPSVAEARALSRPASKPRPDTSG